MLSVNLYQIKIIKYNKMKKQLFTVLITALTIVFVVSCKDDDDVTTSQPTCFDGIQNGDETGVDCGGSSCEDCVFTLLHYLEMFWIM